MVFALTWKCLDIAYICVMNEFSGSLPWLATMVSCAWAAYGASAAFYYGKSGKEQVAKIEKFGTESPVVGVDVSNTPTI